MARRKVLRGSGLPEHPQPFPPAVAIGGMVFTSALGGYDPCDGSLPEGIEQQIGNAFAHLDTAMRLAGGDAGSVAKVTVYLASRDDRIFVNPEWERRFPDPEDRPVRHTVIKALPGNMLVQIEAIGVV